MTPRDRMLDDVRFLTLALVIVAFFIVTNWHLATVEHRIERLLPPVTTTTAQR